MKLNKRMVGSLIVVVALFIVIAISSGSFADFTWTWQTYDNPTGTEYRSNYGTTWGIPELLLPKYGVPSEIMAELNILPAFSPKKIVAHSGGPGEYDKPNNYLYTPRHEELQAYIRDLANSPEGKQRMRIKPIGEYPKGYPLYLAIFSKPAVLEPEDLKALNKPLVWVHGSIHANEQDAVSAMAYVMYKLASGQWDNYLEKASIMLFPRLNADGAFYNIRGNPTRPDKRIRSTSAQLSSAIDMNRDNMWLESPVLRAAHSIWGEYEPHFGIDLHQMSSSMSTNPASAYLASRDENGNIVYHSSGRVQLLIDRNPDGSPIVGGTPALNSSGSLTNAWPADERPRSTSQLYGGNLYYIYDTGHAIGDHGNVPPRLRSYYYNTIVPAVASNMSSRGNRLGWYLDAPRAPEIGEWLNTFVTPNRLEKIYMPYAGDRVPNTNASRDINVEPEYFVKYDGTGVPAGATNGLWLDPGNMMGTFSLKGGLGILFESRAPSHNPWTYPKRTHAQHSAIEGVLKHAAENSEEVLKLFNDARKDIIDMDKVYTMMKYDDDHFIVREEEYYRTSASGDIPGNIGDIIKVDFPIYSPQTTFPKDANSVRAKPYAYILPKSEINAITAARIGMHGVKYHVLNQDMQLSVEAFGDMRRGPFIYPQQQNMRAPDPAFNTNPVVQSADLVQWQVQFFVETDPPVNTTVTVPKGSYVFYTAQPMGAYLAAAMEPDAERSFTRLTMARRSTATNPAMWSVPYRYMIKQDLPTTEVIQYYPLVENAFIADVRPITGGELAALGSSYVMAQDLDVTSDANGFFMQLPASASGLKLFAYDWGKSDFVELEKVTKDEYKEVKNVYKITPDHLSPQPFAGHSYETSPRGNGVSLAQAMETKVVRIAATDKSTEPEDPEKPWTWEDIGCNAGVPLLAVVALLGIMLRKK